MKLLKLISEIKITPHPIIKLKPTTEGGEYKANFDGYEFYLEKSIEKDYLILTAIYKNDHIFWPENKNIIVKFLNSKKIKAEVRFNYVFIPRKYFDFSELFKEIKVQNFRPSRGIKELKLIFPKVQKYFPDAKIGYVDHPIGLTAYIYFTSKNKKSERYGDKWEINYFPFHPTPPDYEPGRYMLGPDDRQNNPNYYPGYADIFPQNKNPSIFLQELARFFREPYQEPEI